MQAIKSSFIQGKFLIQGQHKNFSNINPCIFSFTVTTFVRTAECRSWSAIKYSKRITRLWLLGLEIATDFTFPELMLQSLMRRANYRQLHFNVHQSLPDILSPQRRLFYSSYPVWPVAPILSPTLEEQEFN